MVDAYAQARVSRQTHVMYEFSTEAGTADDVSDARNEDIEEHSIEDNQEDGSGCVGGHGAAGNCSDRGVDFGMGGNGTDLGVDLRVDLRMGGIGTDSKQLVGYGGN